MIEKLERPSKQKKIYSALAFPLVVPSFSKNESGGVSANNPNFIVPGENLIDADAWETIKKDKRIDYFFSSGLMKDQPFSKFEESVAFGKVNKRVYLELLAKKPQPIITGRIFGEQHRNA